MNFKNYFISRDFLKSLIPLYCKFDNDRAETILNFIISKTVMFACIDNFSMDGICVFINKLVSYITNNIDVPLDTLNDFSNQFIFNILLERFKLSMNDLNSNTVCMRLSKYIIENIRLKNYMFTLNDCWDKGYIVVNFKNIDGDVDSLYKRYLSLNMNVMDIFNYCLIDCETEYIDEFSESIILKLPNYNDVFSKLVCDSIEGKIKILNDSSIRIESDGNGRKKFCSTYGDDEVKLIKNILCDYDVFNAIIFSNNEINDRWIPYFSGHILDDDENIIKIFKFKSLYFSYVSASKRNDVSLMKKCISGDDFISKDIIYLVGENVLNDLDFVSLLIIKIKDEEFDFYNNSSDSIDGSDMAYGKLFGEDVQKSEKFWNLLNSRIRLFNKKYALAIPLFDVNKEIVLASRYFDDLGKC